MKHRAKILKKLLDKGENYVDLDQMIEDYTHDNHVTPEPKGKDKYVGIEIECYTKIKFNEVMGLLLAHDLEDYFDVGDDGSIHPPYDNGSITRYNTYELRVLCKEKDLTSMFKKLTAFLKEGEFEVNGSCGLHVHLDMRNRDVEKCYKKLLKFQDVLFGIVDSDRWDTEYTNWSEERRKGERMTAINYTAYEDLKTIEVRLHEGTVDATKIQNWVRLLIKAVGGKTLPTVKSKAQVVKWAGSNKKIKEYLKREFNADWFKNRADVIDDVADRLDDVDGDIW